MTRFIFGLAVALFGHLLMYSPAQALIRFAGTPAAAPPQPIPEIRTYLPLLVTPVSPPPLQPCPSSSANRYVGGTAYQYDLDNPVRPAWAHADKNLALRSYAPNTDTGILRELVSYGTNDPRNPPQFATFFAPYRVPPLSGFYRVHDWVWRPSPDPGSRGAPLTDWTISAIGLEVTPSEALHVPTSSYDIGEGYEVVVLYADESRVTLRYAREDSAGAPGYTLHIDGLCTDPNLLALYAALDAANGPRHVYRPLEQRPYAYPLPALPAGEVLGIARATEVVIAIVDSGSFMDPRSCDEWWRIRPGYTGACPPHE